MFYGYKKIPTHNHDFLANMYYSGQNPMAGHDPRSQYPNMMEHRFPGPPQQVPPNQPQVPSLPGQSKAYKAYHPESGGEPSRMVPGALGEQRKLSEQDQREHEKPGEAKEEKKELVEDKQMNEADIEELLSTYGYISREVV